ncbi:unnamed protein product [Litomosoides sigmodontis]|uniref:Uncharacterized protein n=1 Tax=Litomosoides sigmodontis TaxID=42156 RepID=A0A3P6SUI5_LITSI|nr:unnamed protein product [Litomosoides sigmodontis]
MGENRNEIESLHIGNRDSTTKLKTLKQKRKDDHPKFAEYGRNVAELEALREFKIKLVETNSKLQLQLQEKEKADIEVEKQHVQELELELELLRAENGSKGDDISQVRWKKLEQLEERNVLKGLEESSVSRIPEFDQKSCYSAGR